MYSLRLPNPKDTSLLPFRGTFQILGSGGNSDQRMLYLDWQVPPELSALAGDALGRLRFQADLAAAGLQALGLPEAVPSSSPVSGAGSQWQLELAGTGQLAGLVEGLAAGSRGRIQVAVAGGEGEDTAASGVVGRFQWQVRQPHRVASGVQVVGAGDFQQQDAEWGMLELRGSQLRLESGLYEIHH